MLNNRKVSEQAKNQALRLYEQARQKSLWATVQSLLNRDGRRLLHMEEIHAAGTVPPNQDTGVQSVPIAHIRGSVNEGRTFDFDADFRPLKTHNKERWLGLAAAWQRGVKIPPVGLIKIGDAYFVRDGHHRISVARAMEQTEIRADVAIWRIAEHAIPIS